ncbi:MAG: sulfatase/phosphatase domain-containing protein [Bacteroidales bacterium]
MRNWNYLKRPVGAGLLATSLMSVLSSCSSAVQKLDGKSFVPMLLQKGTTDKGRNLYWHFPNNWGPTGPGIATTSTIRSSDWKLIYWYENQHFQLFNILEDIGELHNLAGENQKKVKELAKELGQYLRSVDAQRPIFKSTGKPVPWPDELI